MNYRQLYKKLNIKSYQSIPAVNGKKECSICCEKKSVKGFCQNKRYNHIDGRHPWCMDCTDEINDNRNIQGKYAKPHWFSSKHEKKI